jgi:amino acid transporter
MPVDKYFIQYEDALIDKHLHKKHKVNFYPIVAIVTILICLYFIFIYEYEIDIYSFIVLEIFTSSVLYLLRFK